MERQAEFRQGGGESCSFQILEHCQEVSVEPMKVARLQVKEVSGVRLDHSMVKGLGFKIHED